MHKPIKLIISGTITLACANCSGPHTTPQPEPSSQIFTKAEIPSLLGAVGIAATEKEELIFVACYDTDTINTFSWFEDKKQYRHLGTFKHQDLRGPYRLTLSKNQRYLFVASHIGDAIVILEVTEDKLLKHVKTIRDQTTNGVAAVYETDGLLINTAYKNASLSVRTWQKTDFIPTLHTLQNNDAYKGAYTIAPANYASRWFAAAMYTSGQIHRFQIDSHGNLAQVKPALKNLKGPWGIVWQGDNIYYTELKGERFVNFSIRQKAIQQEWDNRMLDLSAVRGVDVSPNGKWLSVHVHNSGKVHIFKRNLGTGTLTLQQTINREHFPLHGTKHGLWSHDSKTLFVTSMLDGALSIIRLDENGAPQ